MRKMKDSGIPWIGKIPDNWTNGKLLYLLSEKISDGPHETPDYQNDGIPFISVDSLSDSEEINFDIVKKFITVEDYHRFCEKSVLNPGDVLFSKAATIGKTAIVPNKKFMIWSPLAILKPAKGTDSKFLYWLLSCKELVDEVKLSGSENTQINVGMRELEHINVPIIPINDQRKIAHYLDIQNNKITSFIQKQQDLIDKLTAYKQSLITETVTRGLDPSVPMKDSGIPWIGKIPDHWIKEKLKYLCYSIGDGLHGTPTYGESDIFFINGTNLGQKNIVIKEGTNTVIADDFKKYQIELNKDSILISLNGTIGNLSRYHNEKIVLSKSAGYLNIRADKISADFIWFYLKSTTTMRLFEESFAGTTIKNLSLETLRNLAVLLPPEYEQRKISIYLDNKCSQIDTDISKRQQLIDKLKEYKKSLIYEVVTGKREVE